MSDDSCYRIFCLWFGNVNSPSSLFLYNQQMPFRSLDAISINNFRLFVGAFDLENPQVPSEILVEGEVTIPVAITSSRHGLLIWSASTVTLSTFRAGLVLMSSRVCSGTLGLSPPLFCPSWSEPTGEGSNGNTTRTISNLTNWVDNFVNCLN